MVSDEIWEALDFVCSAEFWRMGLFWTFSLLVSYFQLLERWIFARKSDTYARSLPPSTNSTPPVCIVTGATSGLGAAAACALAKEGFYVVLVGRSSDKLSKTLADIKIQHKNAHLKAFEVDMSSVQSIMKFNNSFQTWLSDSQMHPSIQLLVNNAGILAMTSRRTTEGYDQMIATNYIGAFFLTKLMLPLLKNSPFPSRIVNVTSFTHRTVQNVKFDKEAVMGKHQSSKRYPCGRIYEFSKLCVLLFTYELHRQLLQKDELCHVSVVAADPGFAKTNIMREVPSYLSHVAFFVLKLLGVLQSPEDAVNSIIDAALSPEGTSGVYFFGGKGRTINSTSLSYDTKLATQLWKTTSDLVLESQLASNESFTIASS